VHPSADHGFSSGAPDRTSLSGWARGHRQDVDGSLDEKQRFVLAPGLGERVGQADVIEPPLAHGEDGRGVSLEELVLRAAERSSHSPQALDGCAGRVTRRQDGVDETEVSVRWPR
jgi:hypothetical protein